MHLEDGKVENTRGDYISIGIVSASTSSDTGRVGRAGAVQLIHVKLPIKENRQKQYN